MTHRVNNHVRHEFKSELGIMCRIFWIVCPFKPVAKVSIPCHKNAYSASLIENGEHLRDSAGRTVFPLLAISTLRNSIVRHLDDFTNVIEAVEKRMRYVQFHRC